MMVGEDEDEGGMESHVRDFSPRLKANRHSRDSTLTKQLPYS